VLYITNTSLCPIVQSNRKTSNAPNVETCFEELPRLSELSDVGVQPDVSMSKHRLQHVFDATIGRRSQDQADSEKRYVHKSMQRLVICEYAASLLSPRTQSLTQLLNSYCEIKKRGESSAVLTREKQSPTFLQVWPGSQQDPRQKRGRYELFFQSNSSSTVLPGPWLGQYTDSNTATSSDCNITLWILH